MGAQAYDRRRESHAPERLRRVLPVVIGLALFLAALEVLRFELRTVSWHDLTADVLATTPPAPGGGAGLTR